MFMLFFFVFFFKQKTAYEMRISDWSSDVCSSDLDRKGVIYQGRPEGMDQWKSAHAAKTSARTLEDALKGADIFLGLSAAGAVKPEMVRDMAAKPIIFAMANPDPEISPPEAKAARPDAIIATGRSDYPNQVNNRTEERRVGKTSVSTCKSRWSPE